MNLNTRIATFIDLGKFLNQFYTLEKTSENQLLNKLFFEDFDALIVKQKGLNGWFTENNVRNAIGEIAAMLKADELKKWLAAYPISEEKNKKIGVIMAGNIPLVGFHDFLSVLISGNIFIGKCASSDNTLIKKIAAIIIHINPEFNDRIIFTEQFNKNTPAEAFIATGSNNSARYFEYYFGKYPSIIRKNRNSIAIINGSESKEELTKLGNDIFNYFGLGCRNVAKLYVPKEYDFTPFFEAIFDFQEVVNNNKYANNYDYHKAIYLLNSEQLLDNNFVLLKEDKKLSSPVGVIFYEYYDSIEELQKEIQANLKEIQCVVSQTKLPFETVNFGAAQSPQLCDYADGVDTMSFLNQL